ncbi:Gfo/Idh/MocA family protein [Dactylosporangium sp. CS-047395]|uniref:Gfo/Idh/MocA family protein n=1 Tax=Dactylosporangium sp. CS-047395 TaxID=3239936 RepID=UPI003D926E2B
MDIVRYGIVGTGYFGAELGRILSRQPGSAVSRIYDPVGADRIAAELGCTAADDIAGVTDADDVDAVIVASPNHAHREPVERAARAGKPVFCEKPIALSYEDCRAMLEATSRAGVLFMAGHVMNFMHGVRAAKRLIAEGAIGELLYCHTARNGWEERQGSVSWKKRRELSGGHLYHHIHELDLVQFLLGPARTATMVGGNVAHRGAGFGDEDDLLLITLEFAGGRYAMLEYGSAFRWPEHYVLIQGTAGAIRIDLQDVGVELRTPERSERMLLHATREEDEDRKRFYGLGDRAMDGAIMYGDPSKRPPLWLRGIMEAELRYFDDLVRGATPDAEFAPLTDGSAATAAIATADALTLSLREGRKVAVAEITA